MKNKPKWAVIDLGVSGELVGNVDSRGRDVIHIQYDNNSEYHITFKKLDQ